MTISIILTTTTTVTPSASAWACTMGGGHM
jgi:hypothetical protein